MIAVYKRELHAIFHSVIGYVFMAVILFFTGLYFMAFNLTNGYPYFAYTLSSVVFVTLLMTPVLTMRIMTEDKKQNTDQLLYTSPVSLPRIIIGKYLSLLTTFLIPMAVISLYPLILSAYGNVAYLETYSAIIGFIVYGALCLAIGMFISSITENQIVAAILTLVVLYIGYMMDGITSLLFQTENIFSDILNGYNFYSRLSSFFSGTFDLNSLLYFITMTALFLYFTYQVVQKKRWSMSQNRLKRGVFNIGSIVLAIVLTVAVNYGVSKIPQAYTIFDVTNTDLYGISEQTKNIVSALDEDITVYVLASESNADGTVLKTLNQYDDLSEHITIEYRDPSLYPNFATQYSEEALADSSIVVESAKRYKAIPYSDLYETTIDYNTYQETTTGYDAEGQLTSAIDYVASDTISKMYILSGHNELELPESLQSQIAKENINTETINLLNYDAVPEDAACLFLSAPTDDYSAEDAEKVLSYLQNGGSAIVISSWSDKSMANFNAIWEEYGIQLVNGIVVEGDASHYSQNPYYLFPDIAGGTVTSTLTSADRYVFMPYAQGITVNENLRDTLTVEQILTTTDSAYAKIDPANMTTFEKEDGDIDGPFALGVYATEAVGEKQTQLLYLTTENFISESANETVAGGNYELLMNAASKMVQHETSVSIPAKSYEVEYLTVPYVDALLWGLATMLILPIGLIIFGIVVWARRRKR